MVDSGAWLLMMRSQAPALRVPRHTAVGDPKTLPATAPAIDALLDEHCRAAAADVELYALVAIATKADVEQQIRALAALVATSRTNATDLARGIADRVIAVLVAHLPDAAVLRAFAAARRMRANHKHTTRAFVGWLFRHPNVDHVIASHRRVVTDLLEHTLGRNVARACIKHVDSPSEQGASYLAKHLHRLLPGLDRARTESLLAYLAHGGPPESRRQPVHSSDASVAKFVPPTSTTAADPAAYDIPKTVTATNRGDIAATLVHLYQGGDSAMLRQGLDSFVERAASSLPQLPIKIALVVDASLSTLGYGDRRYTCISQSWALRLVLGKLCPNLTVHLAGGGGDAPSTLPHPEGATDLALPLLDALATQPDVVAIVTDGYENRTSGELTAILEALPRANIATPIVIINSKFTHKDDLTFRRPASNAHQLDIWHEADFAIVVETLGSLAHGPLGRTFLHTALVDRLSALERSRPSWILPSHASL